MLVEQCGIDRNCVRIRAEQHRVDESIFQKGYSGDKGGEGGQLPQCEFHLICILISNLPFKASAMFVFSKNLKEQVEVY